MTQPSTPRRVALATLVLVTMTAAACGHSSPVAPDAAAASHRCGGQRSERALAAKPGSGPTASADRQFPLLAGDVHDRRTAKALRSAASTRGETTSRTASRSTTLRLEVQKGTGGLGRRRRRSRGHRARRVHGRGSLLARGIRHASARRQEEAKFRASLQGWSNIGCDAGHVIISSTRTGPMVAKSGGEMRHEVGNAGCGF